MNAEQVNKSIKQMRQMFGFFGVLISIGAVLALFNSFSDSSYLFGVVIEGALAACFWIAFKGLGDRNKTGLNFARVSSAIFILAFPILTVFGIIYLIKLSKTEMMEALGVE